MKTKIRKYKGSYTIPIHKHTKVRRPKSKWVTNIFANYEVGDSLYFGHLTPIKVGDYVVKVQDISKGLEDPLKLTLPLLRVYDENGLQEFPKHQKGDWNEWGEWTPEMVKMIDNIKLPKNSDITFFSTPKPSLLTRVKNKLKRRK